jgi:hypothetical protein
MTVSTEYNYQEFIATDGQTIFDFSFPYHSQADILVYSDGNQVGLAQYTVSPASSDNGGRVTVNDPGFAAGSKILIVRTMPFTQEFDYQPYGPFMAESHERALDALLMLIQQINGRIELEAIAQVEDVEAALAAHLADMTNPHQTDWVGLLGKPTEFPPADHTHTTGDLTDYDAAVLDAVEEAYHWANMDEGVPVPESDAPPEYSAYHWARQAREIAGGPFMGDAPIDGRDYVRQSAVWRNNPRVEWKGDYNNATQYYKNDMAREQGIIGIANQDTTAPIIPATVGGQQETHDGTVDPVWFDNCYFGVVFTPSTPVRIDGFRFNKSGGQAEHNYAAYYLWKNRYVGIYDAHAFGTASGIHEFLLAEPIYMKAGEVLKLYRACSGDMYGLDGLGTADWGPTAVKYNYKAVDTFEPPANGEIIHHKTQLEYLYISRYDADGTDRIALFSQLADYDYIELPHDDPTPLRWVCANVLPNGVDAQGNTITWAIEQIGNYYKVAIEPPIALPTAQYTFDFVGAFNDANDWAYDPDGYAGMGPEVRGIFRERFDNQPQAIDEDSDYANAAIVYNQIEGFGDWDIIYVPEDFQPPPSEPTVDEAPLDSVVYGRRDAGWHDAGLAVNMHRNPMMLGGAASGPVDGSNPPEKFQFQAPPSASSGPDTSGPYSNGWEHNPLGESGRSLLMYDLKAFHPQLEIDRPYRITAHVLKVAGDDNLVAAFVDVLNVDIVVETDSVEANGVETVVGAVFIPRSATWSAKFMVGVGVVSAATTHLKVWGYSLSAVHTHALNDLDGLQGTLMGEPDAPSDGLEYVRQNGAWVQNTGGSGGISDAPSDGTLYGRKDAAWLAAAEAAHIHAQSDITGLGNDLDVLTQSVGDNALAISNKADAAHIHPQSDITDLVTDLQDISTSLNLLTTGKADTSHNHDGVYEPVDATLLRQADVDDTPVDGATAVPVSSNWAYDHLNADNPHNIDTSRRTATIYNGTGAALAKGDIVFISGDQAGDPSVTASNAGAVATASGMLLMVAAAIANANTGEAVICGLVDGFTGLTIGAPLYLSETDKAFSETQAATVVRIVGYAWSATEVYFDPERTYIEQV